MATKALSDFLIEVRPHVDGCPDPVMENAVRNAAIDFCVNSKMWRYDLDHISVAPNVPAYDLGPPTNSVIAEVLSAEYDGNPIYPKPKEDLDREVPGWRGGLTGTVVGYFLSPDKATMTLVRTPARAIANGLIVEAALKPSRAATVLESWIFEDHLETIAIGARWKLYAMKGMKWESAGKAESCERDFLKRCADAATVAAKSNTRGPLRTRPVYSME